MVSLFFKKCSRSFFPIGEPEESFTFSLNWLMSWGNAFSVGKCFLTRLSFVWEHCDRFGCTFSEVRWTGPLSSLGMSEKLLLSPVSTAVKPAYSVFEHRPLPIQEGDSQCSQLNHKSTSCSVCGRTWVWPLSSCSSDIGPKDTLDGSPQGKSSCEDDIDKSLLDRQEEGRIGVHVESEVVLSCAGNNNEGACDMLCWMRGMTVFCERHMKPDSMTQVFSPCLCLVVCSPCACGGGSMPWCGVALVFSSRDGFGVWQRNTSRRVCSDRPAARGPV